MMVLPRELAQEFWPFGSSNPKKTGTDLPEQAKLCMIENRWEIPIEPIDVLDADWYCEDSAWAEGEPEAKEYDSVRFMAEDAVLLRLKHLEEAKKRGFEERELKRAAAAERAELERLDRLDEDDEDIEDAENEEDCEENF